MSHLARIHTFSQQTCDAAEFINLGWSILRWMEAVVDAQVLPESIFPTHLGRSGPQRSNDILVLEKPRTAAGLVEVLEQLSQRRIRAIIIPQPPQGGSWCSVRWSAHPGAECSTNTEAALLATVVEQHFRWRGNAALGHVGDPISVQAITDIFTDGIPLWPTQPTSLSRRPPATPLHLRTLIATDSCLDAASLCAEPGLGLIFIPDRSVFRLSTLVESSAISFSSHPPQTRHQLASPPAQSLGCVTQPGGHLNIIERHYSCPETTVTLHVNTGDVVGYPMTAIFRTPSLLDPTFHQVWAAMQERLGMPWLRRDLCAAHNPEQARKVLLLEDLELPFSILSEPRTDNDHLDLALAEVTNAPPVFPDHHDRARAESRQRRA